MTILHTLKEFLSISDHSGFYHLTEKVISFPRTLADTGKHRESVMLLGDVIYELLDKDRLTYTGTSEKSDLSSLEIRFKKVNDLDTSK